MRPRDPAMCMQGGHSSLKSLKSLNCHWKEKLSLKCPWSPWITEKIKIVLEKIILGALMSLKSLNFQNLIENVLEVLEYLALDIPKKKFFHLAVKTLPMVAFITLIQYHRLTIKMKWYCGLFFKQLKSVFSFFTIIIYQVNLIWWIS